MIFEPMTEQSQADRPQTTSSVTSLKSSKSESSSSNFNFDVAADKEVDQNETIELMFMKKNNGQTSKVALVNPPPPSSCAALLSFAKREIRNAGGDCLPRNYNPRPLFVGSSKLVPNNSDAESCD